MSEPGSPDSAAPLPNTPDSELLASEARKNKATAVTTLLVSLGTVLALALFYRQLLEIGPVAIAVPVCIAIACGLVAPIYASKALFQTRKAKQPAGRQASILALSTLPLLIVVAIAALGILVIAAAAAYYA